MISPDFLMVLLAAYAVYFEGVLLLALSAHLFWSALKRAARDLFWETMRDRERRIDAITRPSITAGRGRRHV